LLKRRAAGRVGGRAPKFCGHIFCTKNRIRAGFNTSAESGYSSNGIAALAVELETSPEQNGFGRTAFNVTRMALGLSGADQVAQSVGHLQPFCSSEMGGNSNVSGIRRDE
jgi:hypothetical protein